MQKKNNSIDSAIFSPNVNVFRLILFSILAHRLSIWRGDYLIVCWHADKKSTLENRNNSSFRMEFRRIAFSVPVTLFFPMCFHSNLNGMHSHKEKEREWRYTFITISIFKLHQCEWVEKLFT